MAIDTFSGLKTAVADYLNRDDLTTAIPNFISLAEAKFNRKLRTRQMVKRANAPIDTQYFAYPADYLETKTFKLNTNPITVLEFATEEYSDTLRSTRFTTTGKPAFFSIVGNQLEVIPAPDTEYSAELTYYAKITALSDANTSNWLLAYAPDLYLYGALLEATPYLKDDERLVVWGQLYIASVEDIVVADQRASVATTPIVRARTLG
jgi:hypothetical protein